MKARLVCGACLDLWMCSEHLQLGRDKVMASSGGIAIVSHLHTAGMLMVIDKWHEVSGYGRVITSATQTSQVKQKKKKRRGAISATTLCILVARERRTFSFLASAVIQLGGLPSQNPRFALSLLGGNLFLGGLEQIDYFFISIHGQTLIIWDKPLWKSVSSGSGYEGHKKFVPLSHTVVAEAMVTQHVSGQNYFKS